MGFDSDSIGFYGDFIGFTGIYLFNGDLFEFYGMSLDFYGEKISQWWCLVRYDDPSCGWEPRFAAPWLPI